MPSLPHSRDTELAALRVISAAPTYSLIDPLKLAAAYRVVERNTTARTAMYGELLRAVS